jgi:hypothetical protein
MITLKELHFLRRISGLITTSSVSCLHTQPHINSYPYLYRYVRIFTRINPKIRVFFCLVLFLKAEVESTSERNSFADGEYGRGAR